VGELAADLTRVGPGQRVLDIGCGPGSAARVAVRRGATTTGVDPAAVMLRLARLFTWNRGASWRSGTAESLPVDDASVDIAWSLSTVHHWNDIERGLAEVRRVLVPGGRFLVTERRTEPNATGHRSHGWTTDQADAFAATCAAADFTVIEVSTHTPRGVPTLVVQGTKPGAS
jgi:ubiquinone/menaquinone biosynthesis C-methylase UbiE